MTIGIGDADRLATEDIRHGRSARLSGGARVPIRPILFEDRGAKILLRNVARALQRLSNASEPVNALREQAQARASRLDPAISPETSLAVSVLCDLRAQGWQFEIAPDEILAIQPTAERGASDRKHQVRTAHLLERDAQLRQRPVRRFVRYMEQRRLYEGEWHSIFSLMRDGKVLAAALQTIRPECTVEEASNLLSGIIDPYIELAEKDSTCSFTGLRLLDVWRYFRHTWATTYNSTPGRSMAFLVRDRAAANHPVIGIGALGSSIVQLSRRDEWIGWTPDKMLEAMSKDPSIAHARWLASSLTALIKSIRSDDLLRAVKMRDMDLKSPTCAHVGRLRAWAERNRIRHELFPGRADHKAVASDSGVDWARQSNTYLFRAKRAERLADLLEARVRLSKVGFTRASASRLATAIDAEDGRKAIQTVLRGIKSSAVGVHMMDITVCGAIAPYNYLLGGKLVALLMASPEVVNAYNSRYSKSASVIASSMAGRAVRRKPHLVLLGTTSLYDVAPAQYNRLRMPADLAGGKIGTFLRFIELGATQGFGSFHFSQQTMQLMKAVIARTQRGRIVNSIFGEGVNPKLRKMRQALDALGFPANALMQHGSPRLIYQIPLASNFREILLGLDRSPSYLVEQTTRTTETIAKFWRERWLLARASRPETLAHIACETTVSPVHHGARVILPDIPEEDGPLFAGNSRDF